MKLSYDLSTHLSIANTGYPSTTFDEEKEAKKMRNIGFEPMTLWNFRNGKDITLTLESYATTAAPIPHVTLR